MTDILFERRGKLGLITLNRPQALNALTHEMILALERQLDRWREDEAILAVAIQGAGEKAFCAGGDIRVLYEAGRPGGEAGQANFQFYADEYRVNTKIKRYPKPYISLMDGIVMGGGVGVSIHGSLRIATERTVFAMPETGIGLFPDVGGTYFLPRLPGSTGLWLGLTGSRLRGIDARMAGICDHFVQSDALPGFLDELEAAETAADIPGPADFARPLDPPFAEQVDHCFQGETIAEVLDRLAEDGSDWAGKQRATILGKSPTCTKLAFRQIQEGARLGFEDCMRLEYRLARFCMTHGDFYEGVRAQIIDKDNAPQWSPASLDTVEDAAIDAAFAPLGKDELTL